MTHRHHVLVLLAGMALASSALAEGGIKSRSADDAYNDMMRNFGAAPSGQPSKQVMTRSVETAHADMMRDWGFQPSGEPMKEALTQSERDRYADLIRANHGFARLEE
ncbi:MAG: hypothetical protein FJY37_20440 [Betaproteobacteria bacterium]|nr:hypothetical protein [Betaproteobacteria bacterium]